MSGGDVGSDGIGLAAQFSVGEGRRAENAEAAPGLGEAHQVGQHHK